MATRKTYQLIHYQSLDTYVSVNGKKVLIQFRGGSLKPKINGKFTSTDPDVIAAMDKGMLAPGAAYRCIDTFTDDKPVSAPKNEEPQSTSEEGPEGFQKVEGITTIQMARDYLLKNIDGLVAAKLPNGNAIREQARIHKIEFTDLK
jgi:hypothetical protein